MLCAQAARADFDPATGKVTLSDEGVGWGLENLETAPAELPVFFMTPRWDPVPDDTVLRRFVYDGTIEGQGALAMGGGVYRMLAILTGVRDRFSGRRVEIRLWQRPQGTRLAGALYWFAGDVDAALARGSLDGLLPMASLPVQPTGRVTDDGWMEMSTGPVDFLLGGSIAPAFLMLSDVHADGAFWNRQVTFDPNLRAWVDALEIVDLGPAAYTDASCTLATEADTCGVGSVCRLGRCVEAAPFVGPALLDEGLRRDYLERRLFEFSHFDGSREAARQMPGLALAWATLGTASTPEELWPVMGDLIEGLHDGHASAPTYSYGAMLFSGGACLTEGEADLLDPVQTAPLVLSTEANHPLGATLKVGDVLTQIDGMPVQEWTALAEPLLSFAGDPAAHDAVVSAQILSTALLTGATLTFERCPGLDATGACAGAIEEVVVPLEPMVAPLWEGQVPAWLASAGGYGGGGAPTCDYRFQRVPVVSDPAGFSTIAWAEQDGVRHVLFNGFPAKYQRGGRAWFDTWETALGTGPARVVIDERQGYGGTVDAMSYATAFFLGSGDFESVDLFPATEQTLDGALRDDLQSCLQSTMSPSPMPCGYVDRWRLQDFQNPSAGAVAQSRVALLLTSDVSGNDFFTKMLTFRSGALRIFGPAPTWGAFGPILELPPHLDEPAGGSFQIQDTVFMGSATSDPLAFSTGTGVPPHEVVRQKQSDALAGVDTLLEAATQWVNQ